MSIYDKNKQMRGEYPLIHLPYSWLGAPPPQVTKLLSEMEDLRKGKEEKVETNFERRLRFEIAGLPPGFMPRISRRKEKVESKDVSHLV